MANDAWLKELEEKWDAAEIPANDPSKKRVYKIREGNDHVFHIQDADVTLTPEKQFIRYKLRIRTHKDWVRTKYTWLGGDMKYPKGELEVLGLEGVTLSNISERIKEAIGKLVNGTVKNVEGKDYQNFYFNSLAGFEPVATDDDIPFAIPDETTWDE